MKEATHNGGPWLSRGHTSHALSSLAVSSVLILIFVPFVGCQRELENAPSIPSSGNHPPRIRAASVLPSPPVLNGPLSVSIDAEDLDRNPLSFHYQWMINGHPVPLEQGELLRPELLKQGDQVAVEIRPHDGIIEGESFTTPTVTVANSPPAVSQVSVEPEVISLGMRVRAHADIRDADHDLIHVTYRWWRNNTLVQEGNETDLDTTPFAYGDVLSVEVEASDSSAAGQRVRSAPVRIDNTAPRIHSVPPTALNQDQFVYQVEASDAESDALTYSLEGAPTSMTIGETSGLVTWRLPQGQTGVHKVRILVSDSRGAVSFQEFEINVASSSSPAPA